MIDDAVLLFVLGFIALSAVLKSWPAILNRDYTDVEMKAAGYEPAATGGSAERLCGPCRRRAAGAA
jgi:hypothetical protein